MLGISARRASGLCKQANLKRSLQKHYLTLAPAPVDSPTPFQPKHFSTNSKPQLTTTMSETIIREVTKDVWIFSKYVPPNLFHPLKPSIPWRDGGGVVLLGAHIVDRVPTLAGHSAGSESSPSVDVLPLSNYATAVYGFWPLLLSKLRPRPRSTSWDPSSMRLHPVQGPTLLNCPRFIVGPDQGHHLYLGD